MAESSVTVHVDSNAGTVEPSCRMYRVYILFQSGSSNFDSAFNSRASSFLFLSSVTAQFLWQFGSLIIRWRWVSLVEVQPQCRYYIDDEGRFADCVNLGCCFKLYSFIT